MEITKTERETALKEALGWALRWVDEIAWSRFNEDERERYQWAKQTLAGEASPFDQARKPESAGD